MAEEKEIYWKKVLRELTLELRDLGEVIGERKKREKYANDRSGSLIQLIPDVVVIPFTIDAVQRTVKYCRKRKINIYPRGAGTGLEGGCLPTQSGIVLSTEKLKHFKIDIENKSCWVGAGVKKEELNSLLRDFGFLFGPDPSSNPSLGGMASTGGSGMTTSRYGTTPENILSLKVVTAEGEFVQTKRPVRKSSTGLNLTQLYCASEGTLGIICELLVRISPLHSHRSGAILSFSSTEGAVKTVSEVGTKYLSSLTRCELLNAECVKCTNEYFNKQLEVLPTLLLEFSGNNPEELLKDWKLFEQIARQYSPSSISFADNGEKLDELWEARRGCYISSFYYRGKDIKKEKMYISDCCVPLTSLTQCVTETEEDFRKEGVSCLICAHIIDGNFHCMIPYANEEEKERVFRLSERMVHRSIRLDGCVSGEHGVGLGKMKYLETEHGKVHLDIQRRIKKALDPDNIMNPGKFYPPPSSL